VKPVAPDPDDHERRLGLVLFVQIRQDRHQVGFPPATCSSAIASSRQTTTDVTPAAACLTMSAARADRGPSAGMRVGARCYLSVPVVLRTSHARPTITAVRSGACW
jgi:hypothetical protein